MNGSKNSVMLTQTGKCVLIVALLGLLVFSCDLAFLGNIEEDVTSEAMTATRGITLKSWPILSYGSKSIEVVTLQYLLNAHGVSCAADGSFGPATRTAVRTFQTKNGLSIDGIVGPATWTRLFITVRKGSTGYAVKAIQYQLKFRYGASITAIDGSFGPETNNAVIKFQAKCGITQDGIAGPQTWSYAICGWVSVPDQPSFTYDSIKRVIEDKGYAFFTGHYNINLVGVRGPSRTANQWDDQLFVLYQENGVNKIVTFGQFTTDPGTDYLVSPINPDKGCAIIVPGQYRGMLAIGTHHGSSSSYRALVQVGSTNVYRDNNRDNILDFTTIEAGLFGINLHHGYGSTVVGVSSAGCQVLNSEVDLTKLLGICDASLSYFGNSFTYTLLDYSDF